ncbi:U3 small nucleolar RNA-associated protein 18 homolog [Mizuhopecten yessoensis]|uniref:U3 small nucleolar RNA-associated protein 18 homolog n=1 Tax=Mizuhopecten yessoensis TaxID=6573 RepID=A0A210R041_MIZYE|nr:U3 small nucleolar RNA-associated protein 18 homolog [Mizuhopecten yessoensis]OWF54383.1 U3 small nucleolar RNA-associated protein 18-like [Mizuhopecten yessoensis]
MLRRKQKTGHQESSYTSNQAKKTLSHKQPVDIKKKRKDVEEEILEGLVLGTPDEVIKKLDVGKRKDVTKTEDELFDTEAEPPKKKEKKPVWEDVDDIMGSVQMTNAKKFDGVKQGEECRIRTDQYTTRLKSKFEKVSSNPNWSKFRATDPETEQPGSDDDSDVEDLRTRTGDFLTTTKSLAKGFVQIKQCPNANRDCPAQGKLYAVEFHPSAQVIMTAGSNQTLSLFQVDGKNNPKIQSVFLDNFPIFSAHFTPNGHEVVLSSKHKSFVYYDMIAGKVVNVPKIKGLGETSMKNFVVSPDGRHLVFLGSYGSMHLISAKSKEWIQSLKMNGNVESVAFSRDGTTMYSHGDDGEVYIWDMSTRDCVHRFVDEGCTKGTSIAASPNGQYLSCGSYSGVVNIYEAETCRTMRSPKPVKALMNLTTPCTDTRFHPSSEMLAMSSNFTERAVKLVHLPSMTVFSNYPESHDHELRLPRSMDFSPNGGYFTVGTNKGSALLYRMKHFGNY